MATSNDVRVRGRVDVTDRNGHRLESHLIDEVNDRAALSAQTKIYQAAWTQFGIHEIYCFTNWGRSICIQS